jgi:hypothetical protein
MVIDKYEVTYGYEDIRLYRHYDNIKEILLCTHHTGHDEWCVLAASNSMVSDVCIHVGKGIVPENDLMEKGLGSAVI